MGQTYCRSTSCTESFSGTSPVRTFVPTKGPPDVRIGNTRYWEVAAFIFDTAMPKSCKRQRDSTPPTVTYPDAVAMSPYQKPRRVSRKPTLHQSSLPRLLCPASGTSPSSRGTNIVDFDAMVAHRMSRLRLAIGASAARLRDRQVSLPRRDKQIGAEGCVCASNLGRAKLSQRNGRGDWISFRSARSRSRGWRERYDGETVVRTAASARQDQVRMCV